MERSKIVQTEKTPAVPPSANPEFDATITFDVPNSDVHNVCLFVAVTARLSNNKKKHLGYVCIGPPFIAQGKSLEQWTKMMSCPFQAVSRWQNLSPVPKDTSSFSKFAQNTLNPK